MKILICDDDELNLKINRLLVEDFFEKRNIMNAQIIEKHKIDLDTDIKKLEDVDIAVLDIELQDEVNGLEIAQALQQQNPYIALVFITSYDNYAMDAWKMHSSGFLQKPVNAEDFKQVFQRIMLQLNGLRVTKMNRLVSLNSKVTIKEREIICIEKISDSKDIMVTTSKKTYVFRATIKEMQKILCDSFVRISRNTLINAHYIYRIESGIVELTNEKEFTLTTAKEREIKRFYSKFINLEA